jgi:hypothetical protein
MHTAIFPAATDVTTDLDEDYPFSIYLRDGNAVVAAHFCAKRLVELRQQIDDALKEAAAPKERPPVDDGEESAVAHQHAGL